MKDLFQAENYRDYLRNEFSGTGVGRGRRAILARHLGCQTSFLSQILTDRAHLSLEHAIRTSEFLGHTPLERKYFMLLVQSDRSGTKNLQSFFDDELNSIKKKRSEVKERIGVRTVLSAEDQMTYYSAWYYSAIHVLSAFPEFKSVEAMSDRLKLEMPTVKKAVRFLESRGFIKKSDTGYNIGATRIHLAQGSPMLARHHANWRMRAIEKVDHEKAQDLHYSAVLGISKKDVKIFKESLLELLQKFESVIEKSEVEEPVGLLLDLFSI